jgi:hypothetical protein
VQNWVSNNDPFTLSLLPLSTYRTTPRAIRVDGVKAVTEPKASARMNANFMVVQKNLDHFNQRSNPIKIDKVPLRRRRLRLERRPPTFLN